MKLNTKYTHFIGVGFVCTTWPGTSGFEPGPSGRELTTSQSDNNKHRIRQCIKVEEAMKTVTRGIRLRAGEVRKREASARPRLEPGSGDWRVVSAAPAGRDQCVSSVASAAGSGSQHTSILRGGGGGGGGGGVWDAGRRSDAATRHALTPVLALQLVC